MRDPNLPLAVLIDWNPHINQVIDESSPGGAAALPEGVEVNAMDAHGSEHHEHASKTAVPSCSAA